MMRNYTYRIWLSAALCMVILAAGCKDFLDEKPNQVSKVPKTIPEAQALLDYHAFISQSDGVAAEVSATDYYLLDSYYNSLTEFYQNMYKWGNGPMFTASTNEWSNVYRTVYYANMALDILARQKQGAALGEFDNVKGQALFIRAKAFYQAMDVWSLPYDPSSAGRDLGVPLRLNINFNEASKRATVAQSYQQIITDLSSAIALLPATAVHVTRPSKRAAHGLLARIYLSMGNYEKALLHAEQALKFNNELMDFSALNGNASFPVAQFNPEVGYDSRMSSQPIVSMNNAFIDRELIASYAGDDLRKTIYFGANVQGNYFFKGSYSSSAVLFSGVANDELYLISAECAIRNGQLEFGLARLNRLLETRWKKGAYVPFVSGNSADCLRFVLQERRKELVMRGLRWADLKRLNREGAGVILSRKIAGVGYELLPNSKRYALPLPFDLIETTSLQQNER